MNARTMLKLLGNPRVLRVAIPLLMSPPVRRVIVRQVSRRPRTMLKLLGNSRGLRVAIPLLMSPTVRHVIVIRVSRRLQRRQGRWPRLSLLRLR